MSSWKLGSKLAGEDEQLDIGVSWLLKISSCKMREHLQVKMISWKMGEGLKGEVEQMEYGGAAGG
jgi:hypothetical protein